MRWADHTVSLADIHRQTSGFVPPPDNRFGDRGFPAAIQVRGLPEQAVLLGWNAINRFRAAARLRVS